MEGDDKLPQEARDKIAQYTAVWEKQNAIYNDTSNSASKRNAAKAVMEAAHEAANAVRAQYANKTPAPPTPKPPTPTPKPPDKPVSNGNTPSNGSSSSGSNSSSTHGVATVGASWVALSKDAASLAKLLESPSSGESGNPIRPEAKYKGSGKHGVKWKEGAATAKSLDTPQGQWTQKDLDFATQKANTLKPGESGYFDLPSDSTSIVHMPDGSIEKATRIWIKNNGTGTFHGYPMP